ncbi:MAG: hypothetical protein KJO07_19600 [Deltaproteobacteria bacterium]|nr:hypothetical protein [Deltaproteobacteria bacterium]
MKLELQESSTREELRRASGMDNNEVLDKMLELGLTGETVAALSLIPPLHVAWADGRMQEPERSAILHGAEGKGIDKGSPAWQMLEDWLSSEPPPAMFEAWSAYIQALGKELLNDQQFSTLKSQILAFAKGVAAAAGGFLGIGSIAKAESQAIAHIESAFQL